METTIFVEDSLQEIKDLIAQNAVKKAIDQIGIYIQDSDQMLSDRFILVKSKFIELRKKDRMGLISSSDFSLESNKLNAIILDLTNDLKAPDLKQSFNQKNKIEGNKILTSFLASKYKYLLTGLFSILYLAFSFSKWDTFNEFIYVIPNFVLLGLSIGIIISILPIENPIKFAFRSTFSVPIICLSIELLFIILVQPVFAGGDGDMTINTRLLLFNIIALILGGFLFSGIAIIGCYIGMFLKSAFRAQLQIKYQFSKINEDYALLTEKKINKVSNLLTGMTAIVLMILPIVLV